MWFPWGRQPIIADQFSQMLSAVSRQIGESAKHVGMSALRPLAQYSPESRLSAEPAARPLNPFTMFYK